MNKEAILIETKQTFTAFASLCNRFDETKFFERHGEKWSAAENLQHLITSTATSTLAFSLPLFVVRIAGGTPNRPSRTYEELVARYQQKLAEGGRATGRFIPKSIQKNITKQQMVESWEKTTEKYLKILAEKRNDAALDKYLVRHPLLGRITLRELCYFTIYHTIHHQNIIEARINSNTVL